MKNTTFNILGIIIALGIFSLTAKAQESEYLIGNDKEINWGGFGGPEISFSDAFGEYSTMAGFKAGVVMDNLVIGAGFMGMLSAAEIEGEGTEVEVVELEPTIAYGGLYTEYFFMREQPVHFSVNALIGPGAYWIFEEEITPTGFHDDNLVESSGFFVVQPGVNVELNLIRPLKFYVTAGYRIVGAEGVERIAADDLSGFLFGFGLRLGKY